ncbi:tripartite motif-containing protein 2-like [Pomacea canaliculata]|uniref:tripartite motif-containing protein 2-like n=1 Tax=Pomacea canaliculata TaxID=400727 RepID=UPI000D72E88C|nr:tripartite motif-containing protein 2-like [Pomacea canaliculata]
MAATQDNMTCAICTEVYRSPRFLTCHHTFCLPCLEELTKRHGDTIPCPTCRAPATVPPGGVCDLQVNFYFTEEALEQARSEKRQSMCPVHTKEVAIFHCTQCDKAICLKCKLTKHEGHATEELSEAVARCKKTIGDRLQSFMDNISRGKDKLESCKQNEKRALEKRAALREQIQVRYDVIVAMAAKYRDEALQELETTCDDVEKGLTADTQRVQDKLNSLLQLQARAQHALSSTCDTEVLQVEREMRCREISDTPLVLSDQTYRSVLHGDFSNYIEDNDMKTFIGSPLKQSFQSKKTLDIVQVGRCGDGECREVHALRQQENGNIKVYYGGTGGDYSMEKGPTLSHPKVKRAHNFDSNEQGTLFAVVDEEEVKNSDDESLKEEEDKNSDDESMKTNNNKAERRCSRVVRLYSIKSDDPIATYTPPIQPFFPSDVCFYGKDVLLIADWMNDCVHVTRVSHHGIEFVCFLPGSGDMVRPTALNLDLNGQLLIGCGDGWVLRVPVDY